MSLSFLMTRQGMEDSSFSALKYSMGLMTGGPSKDAPHGVEFIDIIIMMEGRNAKEREMESGKMVFICMRRII